MSSSDPRQSIQDGIDNVGMNRDQTQGITVAYRLECDGEGCSETFGREDSRMLFDQAHKIGHVSNQSTEKFIFEHLRRLSFEGGWTVVLPLEGEEGPGKDYCHDCVLKGRAPGDITRPGAGRKMKRSNGGNDG